MDIIEALRDVIMAFPKKAWQKIRCYEYYPTIDGKNLAVENLENKLNVDFQGEECENYGLYSINDTLIKSDILGNQTRRHSFILNANYQSLNDYDRLNNNGVLLGLQLYLESRKNVEFEILIDGKICKGKITKIICSNGMLYEIPLENETCAWRYQLQISAEYTIESEEF